MSKKTTARIAHGEMTFLAAAICATLRAAAADTGTDTLEAVTVTAERRSESIQEVPISVTAISGDTLTKFSDVNFEDYAHAIPNLSFGTGSDFGITNGRTITIRGITGGRYRNGQATTSFYIDDTPVPIALDPRVLDLERIEVLRGPQGTLFGSSAMGGTVRLITKAADAQNVTGYIDAQGFDINHGGAGYDVSGTVNLPLVPNELGAKFSAYTVYKPGYFSREYGVVTTPGYSLPPGQTAGVDSHIASDTEYGGMVSLHYTPAALPGLDVTPMVLYQDSRSNGFPLADYSPDNLVQVRPLNIEESSQDEWVFSSLTAKYKMDFGSIIASSAWFHRHTVDVEDNTEVSATFWGPTYATGQLPAEYLASPAPSYLNLSSVTQEIRFESAFSFPVQVIAGLYYTHGKSHTGQDITQPVLTGQPLDLYYPYIQDVPLSNNEAAEFGDLTYTVGGLELSAGVRGSTLEYNKHNYWYGWINGGLTDAYSSHREHSVTPRYTAKYQFTPDYMVYVSAGKGFRAGGSNSVPSQCGASAGSYNSDSLWSYEVGSKDTLFDGHMDLRVAAYRIDWNNIQQNILLPCTYSVTQNAGTATSTGAELEADIAPLHGLNVSLSLGYDDAKITSVPAGATGFVTGQSLNGVPKTTASILADYSVPTSFGTAFVRPQYSFTGRSVSYSVIPVQDGGRPRASYSMVDLHVGGITGPWEAALFAKNLFDVRANLGDEQSEVIELQSPTVRPRYMITQPRTIGIEIKYRINP
jgi:outer membrane receptor protein involved in Fe transport